MEKKTQETEDSFAIQALFGLVVIWIDISIESFASYVHKMLNFF